MRGVNRLKGAREAKGLSREQLAGAVGASLDTIRRAENGKDIRLETARAIAAVLGATVEELFGEAA